MTIALYATIWIALALLAVAALTGNRRAYAAGAVLAIVHVLIALGSTYGWDHDLAVRETARQAGTSTASPGAAAFMSVTPS